MPTGAVMGGGGCRRLLGEEAESWLVACFLLVSSLQAGRSSRPKMTGPASGGARPHTRRFWHVWLTLGHRLDKPVGALLPQLASALRR